MSACFSLAAGVRQGGVLAPVLFTVYVNNVSLKLQNSNYGCVIGAQYLGCISHIFHITGSDVKLVSDYTGTVAFGEMLQCRRMRSF